MDKMYGNKYTTVYTVVKYKNANDMVYYVMIVVLQ